MLLLLLLLLLALLLLLLLFHDMNIVALIWLGFLIGSSFCGVVFFVFFFGGGGILSSLAIIRKRRERWLLYFNCVVAVCVFFSQCRGFVCGLVIVTFPGHSHLLF